VLSSLSKIAVKAFGKEGPVWEFDINDVGVFVG
jgi:hypothetical protein